MTNEPTTTPTPEPIDPDTLWAWCDDQDTSAKAMLDRWGQVDPSRLLEATAIIRRLLAERDDRLPRIPPKGRDYQTMGKATTTATYTVRNVTNDAGPPSGQDDEPARPAKTGAPVLSMTVSNALKARDGGFIDRLTREYSREWRKRLISGSFSPEYDGNGMGLYQLSEDAIYGPPYEPRGRRERFSNERRGIAARISSEAEVRVEAEPCASGSPGGCQRIAITVTYAHASSKTMQRLEELLRSGAMARFIEGEW